MAGLTEKTQDHRGREAERLGQVNAHGDNNAPARIVTEAVANFVRIDTLTIAYKETCRGGRGGRSNR